MEDLLCLTDVDFIADGDVHGLWRRLRADAPVAWTPESDGPGFWSVTRQVEGISVLRDWTSFSAARGSTIEGNRWVDDPAAGKTLPLMDPPRHTELRRVLQSYVAARQLSAVEAIAREQARALADRCSDLVEFDFAQEFANLLPLQVLFSFLDIPRSDWESLRGKVERTVAAGELDQTIADAEMLLYLDQLATARRLEPGDDMLSAIATLEVDGQMLSHEEVVLQFANIISGGLHTTRLVVSGGLLALLEHPAQWQLLCGAPSRLGGAAEEMIRWVSPALVFYRTATRDVVLHGCSIEEGERVAVWLPSLNRDASVFDVPDEFDVTRQPNRHVGFGVGAHMCLGAYLARLELRIAFDELLRSWGSVSLAAPPRRLRSLVLQGVESLRVRVTPR